MGNMSVGGVGTEDVRRRIAVRAQVLGCKSCGLRSTCRQPVPFSGANPSPLVVVGEAPGKEEDASGQPFVGPAGRYLRKAIDDAMGQEGFNKTIAYVNTVSCFPNRTPSTAEVESCRTNLMSQLTLMEPRYVLLCGGVALSAFWPKLRVGEMNSKWWSEDGLRGGEGGRSWFMCIVHPSAVLRSGGSTSKIGIEFKGALERWVAVTSDGKRPGLMVECVKCGGSGELWERNIGVCQKHAKMVLAEEVKVRRTNTRVIGSGSTASGDASTAVETRGGGRRKANRSVTSPPQHGGNAIPTSLFG